VRLVLYQHMQDFVKAAQSLHPCNNQAPLIILADDWYGIRNSNSISTEQTGNIYKISTWYNVMAVNIGSVIKYKMLAEHGQMPLLHSYYILHAGAGMHIGAAWTIMFNIVNSIVNVCNDGDIGLEHLHSSSIRGEEEREQKEPTHDVRAEEHNTKNIIKGNVTSTANSSTTPMMVIDPDLVSNVEKGEPPFQQIGRMKEGYMEDSHKNLGWS